MILSIIYFIGPYTCNFLCIYSGEMAAIGVLVFCTTVTILALTSTSYSIPPAQEDLTISAEYPSLAMFADMLKKFRELSSFNEIKFPLQRQTGEESLPVGGVVSLQTEVSKRSSMSCSKVCRHCSNMLGLAMSALCHSECIWDGDNYRACVTLVHAMRLHL